MSHFANSEFPNQGTTVWRTSDHLLEWSLRPLWRAGLFLVPLIAGGVWLSLQAIRVARVSYQVYTVSATDIQKAIGEDPTNGDLFHNLGLVYSSNPADIDLGEAVRNLRQATVLNPRRWDYWADLGRTCDFAGDTACSDDAFQRALALNPMTPSMQWAVGNHYLLTDRPAKAFPYFRKLLTMDWNYLGPTFQLCFRATRDPEAIYSEVIPHGKDASARFAFLMYLSSVADYESAMRIWGEMISGPDRSPDLSSVKPYLDFLVDRNQIQDARKVWNDLQHAGVIPAKPLSPAVDTIYNAGFEGLAVNTGFDWRTNDSPELIFDFSDPSAYQGTKCLRIDFAVGRNADYDLVKQVVLTKPNTRYQLTAYVRSDNITSESGPRLRVVDLGCGGCIPRASEPTVGTTRWHPVEVDFLTQPQTEAVRVSLWRPPDEVYHSDITGTVWLDDLTLHTIESPQLSGSQARLR
jgi:tetratricopeptide (TPR) repeat protein